MSRARKKETSKCLRCAIEARELRYCYVNWYRDIKIWLPCLLLVCALLQPARCLAQQPAEAAPLTLAGTVTDCRTGEPLYGANVIVDSVQHRPDKGIYKGASADENGRYALRGLPRGSSFRLRVSNVGYNTFDTLLTLTAATAPLHICLRSTVLDAVTVTADSRDRSTFTTVEKIATQHLTGSNAGIEALLKTLPDVNSNNEMSSQFSVRGGSFDENLVYINDVEIYRPQLIRSGQQEGMSIINPDLVSRIEFSPGGFDATYGDRMASVLDISYNHPTPGDSVRFSGSAAVSLLGATFGARGVLGGFDYVVGLRQHSNRYIFGSMDTKGDYETNYTDLQALLGFNINSRWRIEALALLSRNLYGLIPATQTTTFGSFMESMELNIYFDGQEQDRYLTGLGAVTLHYRPNDEWTLKWTTAYQRIGEQEIYDIQSQYWLYEVNAGAVDTGENKVDRGVGTYLEHARNYMYTSIYSTELKGSRYAPLGDWRFGIKLQREEVDDRVREWKWVDSAGYTLPFTPDSPGDASNEPRPPLLQRFCVSQHTIATNRLSGYLYKDFNFLTANDDRLTLVLSARGQLYGLYDDSLQTGAYRHVATHGFVSPRLSVGYRPHQNRDMLFRLAAGLYSQAPFYREYRRDDGSLNLAVEPQHSYQAVGTMVYDFEAWQRPFQLTADIYYKYITNLVPYRIDNLRVRYDANNEAVAYAAGASLRVNGEFVKGIQSWASLSYLKTQEDQLGDTLGWIDRPTDQRLSFKLFFQDYVPGFPYWQMSLSFIAATGLPTNSPNPDNRATIIRLSPYFRVDWGNTIRLGAIEKLRSSRLFKHIDDVWLTIDVFNLFDKDNEVSYIWVADYENTYYPVPNKLTGRQLSAKITVQF